MTEEVKVLPKHEANKLINSMRILYENYCGKTIKMLCKRTNETVIYDKIHDKQLNVNFDED